MGRECLPACRLEETQKFGEAAMMMQDARSSGEVGGGQATKTI
jgi:hypothetical protein